MKDSGAHMAKILSQLRKRPPWLPLPVANHCDTRYAGDLGKPAVENVRDRQCERTTNGPGGGAIFSR